MDVFTAVTALSAVAIVVYFLLSQLTTQSSSWPKTKQPLAYIRKVIPKKTKIHLPINSLNDFIPVGEATVVLDVVQLFVRRGNEFSVYSIDWEQEVVVLIRPVDGVDLKAHPFFREAQRRNAAEVLCVPLERLQDVASAVADQVAHVQEVFIFMTALVNNKEKTFRLLMKKLGLKWSPQDSGEDMDKIKRALVEDSQAGTIISAKGRRPGEKWEQDVSPRWVGHWEREYFQEVCRHAGNEIPGPDFLLPDTIV
uniref:Uncharacterized protein n=1 Tax=Branchiostoma floridae TaxID=7739 RepID=C3YJS8_BRAFL|eukprot:XP_002603374.1 hypothetical protein BRAFLDRAFT_80367 [Branchiostoma floridae]